MKVKLVDQRVSLAAHGPSVMPMDDVSERFDHLPTGRSS